MGVVTVFVRLTGCPLRCGYCDTAYAFSGGDMMTLDEILAKVQGYGARYVCVTGGEPLAQPGVLKLMQLLCDQGLRVSLETSGAIDYRTVDPRVARIVDVKTPGSKMVHTIQLEWLTALTPHDQIKFVICDRADYEWASQLITTDPVYERVEVLFSPCIGQLSPVDLADWIIEDRLPVRFQSQLHKQLWGDCPGR